MRGKLLLYLVPIMISIAVIICIKYPTSSILANSENKQITISTLMEYLNSYDDYANGYTSLSIEEKFINGEPLYFLKKEFEFMWGTGLFLIEETGGEITGIKNVGLDGNSHLFEYDVVEISEGTFIIGYSASHEGNGNIEMIDLKNTGTSKYSIEGVIDNYYENTEKTAIEYGLSSGYGNDIFASSVYLNGKPAIKFQDINEDGNTDIVLTGVKQIFKENSIGNMELEKEYYCKLTYIYDIEKDMFYYVENYSKTIEVSE